MAYETTPSSSASSVPELKREKPRKGKRTPSWLVNMRLDGLANLRKFEERSKECLKQLDGDQWTAQERELLRKQSRPDYVDNQLLVMCLLIDGLERERETTVRLEARELDQVESVQVYNELLDYVHDINGGREIYFEAGWWARSWGYGMAKVCRNYRRGEEPIKFELLDPRFTWWDPKCRSGKFNEDAAFVGEDRWISLEDACRRFPFAKKDLRALAEKFKTRTSSGAVEQHEDTYTSRADMEEGLVAIPSVAEWDDNGGLDTFNSSTLEVCVTTIQYRTYEKVWWLIKEDGSEEELTFPPGVDADQAADMLAEYMVAHPQAKVLEDDKCVIRQARFAGPVLLEDDLADFGGSRYTFVPFWCLHDRNGHPYPVIWPQLDNQKQINKFDAKILEILSTHRVKIEPGALAGMAELGLDLEGLRTEAGRPDAILPVGVTVEQELGLSSVFAELARDKRQRIKETSGLVDELRGLGSKDQSFVALQARKQQGQTSLARVFKAGDDFRRELVWVTLAAMQFQYKGPKIVRVTKNTGGVPGGFAAVNVTDPAMAQQLAMQAQAAGMPLKVAGPIENLTVDLELTSAPNFGAEKDLERERLLEWAKVVPNPMAALLIVAKALENDNFEGAKDLADQIRMVSGLPPEGGMMPPPGMPPGMAPPGAPPGEPDADEGQRPQGPPDQDGDEGGVRPPGPTR